MIDIGGPSLLRAAAKNFAHVAPVPRPELYDARARRAARPRRALARDAPLRSPAQAFAATAAYEASIARLVRRARGVPRVAHRPRFTKVRDLAYGENPHQRAAYYAEAGARRHLLSWVEQLHGRELSYNNLNDLDGARRLAREFTLPACVIVKHANPCGAAVAGTIEEAYERALAADPLSAYGGVVVLNRPVTAGARRAARGAVRRGAARARATTPTRSRRCARSAATRILDDHERRARHARRARLQARARRPARAGPRRRRRRPRRHGASSAAGRREEQWGDLLFAWRVCKHVTLERDRDREGPADDRHRRRPDEPRRRGADRGREGAGARPRPRRAPRSPRTRSSRSPTARSSRSTRA